MAKAKPKAAPKILSPMQVRKPAKDEDAVEVERAAKSVNAGLAKGGRRFSIEEFGLNIRVRERVVRLCERAGWEVERDADVLGDCYILWAVIREPFKG